MGYAGIKRDRPSQLTQAISTAYPPLGNNFHQHPPLSREHKGRGDHLRVPSAYKRGYHSAAAGVTSASSTGGGSRFGASFSSAIRASFSRAS